MIVSMPFFVFGCSLNLLRYFRINDNYGYYLASMLLIIASILTMIVKKKIEREKSNYISLGLSYCVSIILYFVFINPVPYRSIHFTSMIVSNDIGLIASFAYGVNKDYPLNSYVYPFSTHNINSSYAFIYVVLGKLASGLQVEAYNIYKAFVFTMFLSFVSVFNLFLGKICPKSKYAPFLGFLFLVFVGGGGFFRWMSKDLRDNTDNDFLFSISGIPKVLTQPIIQQILPNIFSLSTSYLCLLLVYLIMSEATEYATLLFVVSSIFDSKTSFMTSTFVIPSCLLKLSHPSYIAPISVLLMLFVPEFMPLCSYKEISISNELVKYFDVLGPFIIVFVISIPLCMFSTPGLALSSLFSYVIYSLIHIGSDSTTFEITYFSIVVVLLGVCCIVNSFYYLRSLFNSQIVFGILDCLFMIAIIFLCLPTLIAISRSKNSYNGIDEHAIELGHYIRDSTSANSIFLVPGSSLFHSPLHIAGRKLWYTNKGIMERHGFDGSDYFLKRNLLYRNPTNAQTWYNISAQYFVEHRDSFKHSMEHISWVNLIFENQGYRLWRVVDENIVS